MTKDYFKKAGVNQSKNLLHIMFGTARTEKKQKEN